MCAIVLAGKQNGCVILGGLAEELLSPGAADLWEYTGFPRGATTTYSNHHRFGRLGRVSGATPAEAVSWGRSTRRSPGHGRGVCDSTIAFPLFWEYAAGSANGRRPRKELVHQRERLVAELTRDAKAALEKRKSEVESTK